MAENFMVIEKGKSPVLVQGERNDIMNWFDSFENHLTEFKSLWTTKLENGELVHDKCIAVIDNR